MDYRETFEGMAFNQLVEVAVGYAEDAEKTVVENYKLRAEMKKLKEAIEVGDRLKDHLYERIREFEKRNNELAIELDEYKHAYEHSRAELRRRDEEIVDLNYELENLKETKLGVINSFNLDCEGDYLELKLTHDAGKSFMRNVKVIKEGTAIKVSDFVNTETSVTPKNLWTAGKIVAESFAADVKAKEPEEPVCKTVPCSTVIGKLENYWVNSEGVRIQIRLSEKASAYFKATKPHIIGEEIDIKDLQMKMPDSLQKNMDEFVDKRNKLFDEGCDNYLIKYCTTNIEAKAKHIKNKYDALRKVGFTDNQAMSMLPMWDDEDYV